MCNIAIIVPVYYNAAVVTNCLMQLTRCNYSDVNPTLYIPVTGMHESFIDSFLNNYINTYSKLYGNCDDVIFDDIIPIFDDSIFDPSIMMNDIIGNSIDIDYFTIVEPTVKFESLNWLVDLVNIHKEYIHKRGLGAICTNNKTHTMKTSDKIRWYVDDWSIIRSINGDGFGNGIILSTPLEWKLVGGFKSKDYTNTYATSCFRNGYIVVYAEDVR